MTYCLILNKPLIYTRFNEIKIKSYSLQRREILYIYHLPYWGLRHISHWLQMVRRFSHFQTLFNFGLCHIHLINIEGLWLYLQPNVLIISKFNILLSHHCVWCHTWENWSHTLYHRFIVYLSKKRFIEVTFACLTDWRFPLFSAVSLSLGLWSFTYTIYHWV